MAADGQFHSAFDIKEDSAGFEAVLTIRGELDIRTSPELERQLASTMGRGYRFVVLDLARLEFMDASALHLIARQAGHLAHSGGALTIRSPATKIRRLLDIVGLSDLIRLDPPDHPSSRLGAEESVGVSDGFARDGTQGLTAILKMVTAVPSNEEVINGALQLVVALARATVGGADGVSVSLRRRGYLSTVAASDQTITDMDAGQYSTGEGPCVDASNEGRWFHAESLATEARWPAFTPQARALGINAILSSPLMSRDTPVGALNIYSRSVAAFAPEDQRLAAVFATQASIILTNAGVDVTNDQMTIRFQEALRTRELIAHAEGMLMERDGVSEDGAYAALRRLSLEGGKPLRGQAEDIVASARPPDPDASGNGSKDRSG
jgi:anti-anti-sigma factor